MSEVQAMALYAAHLAQGTAMAPLQAEFDALALLPMDTKVDHGRDDRALTSK